MRWLVAVGLAVGCDPGPNGVFFDAAIDAPGGPGSGGSGSTCMPPALFCPGLGYPPCHPNGVIESCWYQPMPGHCYYLPGGVEECDGTARKSCTELGYYGGTTSCDSCNLDASQCIACAPSTLACGRVSGVASALAVSGTHVAVAVYGAVQIFDGGLGLVTSTTIADVTGLVGVPGGWLVATASPPSVSALDVTGARGAAHSLPSAASSPSLAYGPGGRVFVAWNQLVGADWHVFGAVVEPTGASVVAAIDLFPSNGSVVRVTTDGTSFFVGAHGTLARVASDGAFTVAAGFPMQTETTMGAVDLDWSGTTGWYVSWNPTASHYRAQRFDATGAPVGAVRTIAGGAVLDFVGDGDDLLTLRDHVEQLGDPARIGVLRHTSSGGVTLDAVIGVSGSPASAFAAHLSDDLVVAWNSHLAVVP